MAIAWTVFIAYLCLASFNSLPKIGIGGADKYVHVVVYFVFALLWSCHLRTKEPCSNSALVKVLFAAIIYGSAIEIAQGTFTTTRKADVLDVLANTFGAVLAILMLLFAYRFSNKKI